MLQTHFQKWTEKYKEVLEPWYERFLDLFSAHNLTPPTKKDFLFYCFINSRPPEIVPRKKIYPVQLPKKN